MPTLQGSGTLTAVIGTEHVLADLTSPFAVFQVIIDVANMQTGDAVELQVYTSILNGGALHSAFFQPLNGPPTGKGDQIMPSMPIVSDQEIKFTLKQTAGTGRAYPWKVVSI